MTAVSRIGDNSKIDSDNHGCPSCAHPAVGPSIIGSPDVFTNGKNTMRVDDMGYHTACCGPNLWVATKGSGTVFVNGKAIHRKDDEDQHCGGKGKMIEGSADVFAGD